MPVPLTHTIEEPRGCGGRRPMPTYFLVECIIEMLQSLGELELEHRTHAWRIRGMLLA